MQKVYADACDRNRDPILSVIRPLFRECRAVLEIGSGTGQHAVYFSGKMSHIVWHTSDVQENLDDIQLWIDDAELENIRSPITLDVTKVWPRIDVDAVFSANTVHIMSWKQVKAFFKGTGNLLKTNGIFVLYGPFNYNHQYTSKSNEQFDNWLKARDPQSGIRNFEDLDLLAGKYNMILQEDYEMPANNRILFWKKF